MIPDNSKKKLEQLRQEAAFRAQLQQQYDKEMSSKYTRDMPTFAEWMAQRQQKPQGMDKGGSAKHAERESKRLKLGEILPREQREENLRKMLSQSQIKERLYHATPADIRDFKPGGLDPRVSGHAMWLSNDPKRTPAGHNIGTYDNPRTGVNVMPVHVQAKNPLVIDDKGMLDWAREVYGEGSPEFPYLMPKKWRDKVVEDYDSIILADPHKRGDSHEIIMFHPEKIKSAIGNRGTYDTNVADINKATGGTVEPTQDEMRLALTKGGVDNMKVGGKAIGYRDPESTKINDWNWRNMQDVRQDIPITEIPDYIQKHYGEFMNAQHKRAQAGELSPRDLLKAFTITQSSIGRGGLPHATATKTGMKLPNTGGEVRPEGAFAEWLGSPFGQRYLNAAERGEVDPKALLDIQQKFAPFGKQNQLADQMKYAADVMPSMAKQMNSAVTGGKDEYRDWAEKMKGIAGAKSGFVGSMIGRGDLPTLDARQLNLHTLPANVGVSSIMSRGKGKGAREAVDRLSARQAFMNLKLDPELSKHYQHLAHHAVWDATGNNQTTHEDIIKAMRGYDDGGIIHKAQGGTVNAFDYENPKHVENVATIAAKHRDFKQIPDAARHLAGALSQGSYKFIEDPRIQNAINKAGHSGYFISGKEGKQQIVRKAMGGVVNPIDQMRNELANKTQFKGLSQLQSIGAEEAPSLGVKAYVPTVGRPDNGQMPVGGVDTSQGDLPVGGIDMSKMQAGQQLMPNAPPAPAGMQQGMDQVPRGDKIDTMDGTGMPPTPNSNPNQMGSNILSMTPQGQALAAIKPQGLAKGGNVSIEQMKSELANREMPLCMTDKHGYADGGKVGKASKKEPKNTVKAYKLFRVHPKHPGKLFPLFIGKNDPVEMGQWVDAEHIPTKGFAERPGWHAGDLPLATHIGAKSDPENMTKPDIRPDNQVWTEIEMPNDVDWQSEANRRGTNAKGKVVPVRAHITDQVPTGGHYRYKTNPNMTGNWLIGGAMKVNRVLSDAEVKKINKASGASDLPRVKKQKLSDYGFAEGGSMHYEPAKPLSRQEIEAHADRIARQMAGEENPNKKSKQQLEREKTLQVDIKSGGKEIPIPVINHEEIKGSSMVGVPGDPSRGGVVPRKRNTTRLGVGMPKAGEYLRGVGGQKLESDVPMLGGYKYGAYGHPSGWASDLGASAGLYNVVKKLYEENPEADIYGQYHKMTPASLNHAVHTLDAVLSHHQPHNAPPEVIENLNHLMRNVKTTTSKHDVPYPTFPGFENPNDVMLHGIMNSGMRKKMIGLLGKDKYLSGGKQKMDDLIFALSHPELRNIETGAGGSAIIQFDPTKNLKDSTSPHTTYGYDLPSKLKGRTRYTTPFQLLAPRSNANAIREIKAMGKEKTVVPFNQAKMNIIREPIDEQYINQLGEYEMAMKKRLGYKSGGKVKLHTDQDTMQLALSKKSKKAK